jgi:hypothetical protein
MFSSSEKQVCLNISLSSLAATSYSGPFVTNFIATPSCYIITDEQTSVHNFPDLSARCLHTDPHNNPSHFHIERAGGDPGYANFAGWHPLITDPANGNHSRRA